MRKERRKGFTLVELSIVLIIIGLLIGGILVAQSMMEATRITNQVRQFQQFDIAVSTFKQKFGGLPADSTVFGGDGDGVISSSGSGQAFAQVGEYSSFWSQLTSTQTLIDGHSYSGDGCTADIDVYPGCNIPISAIYGKTQIGARGHSGLSSGVLAYGAYSDPTNPSADGKNYYSIIGPARIFYPLETAGVVNGYQLIAIDKKMDDGNPATGTVVARKAWPNDRVNDPALSTGGYHDTCIISGAVNMSSVWCIIRVDMLSSTGESR